eukprot:gene46-816_t
MMFPVKVFGGLFVATAVTLSMDEGRDVDQGTSSSNENVETDAADSASMLKDVLRNQTVRMNSPGFVYVVKGHDDKELYCFGSRHSTPVGEMAAWPWIKKFWLNNNISRMFNESSNLTLQNSLDGLAQTLAKWYQEQRNENVTFEALAAGLKQVANAWQLERQPNFPQDCMDRVAESFAVDHGIPYAILDKRAARKEFQDFSSFINEEKEKPSFLGTILGKNDKPKEKSESRKLEEDLEGRFLDDLYKLYSGNLIMPFVEKFYLGFMNFFAGLPSRNQEWVNDSFLQWFTREEYKNEKMAVAVFGCVHLPGEKGVLEWLRRNPGIIKSVEMFDLEMDCDSLLSSDRKQTCPNTMYPSVFGALDPLLPKQKQSEFDSV